MTHDVITLHFLDDLDRVYRIMNFVLIKNTQISHSVWTCVKRRTLGEPLTMRIKSLKIYEKKINFIYNFVRFVAAITIYRNIIRTTRLVVDE